MSKNYAVRLRCPFGDDESWILLENRSESLDEIVKMLWDFECQLHGAQRDFPIEATEKGAGISVVAATEAPALRAQERGQRASERRPLHVPVLIRGWSDAKGGTFRENSFTAVVNTAGALVNLATKVGTSDVVYLANSVSKEEQEVRVAYVAAEFEGKSAVGLAFESECPNFWQRTRYNQRITVAMPVTVHGGEPNPFVHSAYTVDISKAGARLDGMGFLAKPGAIVEVKRRWHGKARYRVVWVGRVGTPLVNQVGLACLGAEKDIWGEKLPEDEEKEGEEGTATKKSGEPAK